MLKLKNQLIALLGGALLMASPLLAQDSGPLIDMLVKKGIVTDQEAESLRADLVRDFVNNAPASRLNVAMTNSQIKISGDMRFREDADIQKSANPTAVDTRRDRLRTRFRLNFDYNFTNDYFGGFALQTNDSGDSGNTDLTGGFRNLDIFLSRVYFGWKPNAFTTLTLGKQKNTVYGTDLSWDGDINPTGVTEAYQWVGSPTFDVTLNAAQYLVDQNANRAASKSVLGSINEIRTDAWMFPTQVIFNAKLKENATDYVRFAPGLTLYNPARLGGNTNATTGATLPGANTFADPRGNNALQQATFMAEYSVATPQLPAATQFRLYTEVIKNLAGERRWKDIYNTPATLNANNTLTLGSRGAILNNYSARSTAWLVGARLGAGNVATSSGGKLGGEWVFDVNYRYIGNVALDPNINDSDFALSRMNMKGVKALFGYNWNDFTTFNVTYFKSKAIDDQLGAGTNAGNTLGNARAAALFNLRDVQTWLIDLIVKF